jgi:hypothetical protein
VWRIRSSKVPRFRSRAEAQAEAEPLCRHVRAGRQEWEPRPVAAALVAAALVAVALVAVALVAVALVAVALVAAAVPQGPMARCGRSSAGAGTPIARS